MLEAILNRRSVRFYKPDPVTDDEIAEVLKAGFCAPSAHAGAPWHVVVVKNQAKRDKLSSIHRWSKIIARVPVAIAVCVDKREAPNFWIEDGSAFMENMLIQAAGMGLGTCWIAIQGLQVEDGDAEAIVGEALGLPDYVGVLAITPLGYPARYPGPHEPKLMEGRVHFDQFEMPESPTAG